MDRLPSVCCRCPTFDRIEFLQETLWCFLQQTYKGKKQFFICNDNPDIRLIYEHPEVKIINYVFPEIEDKNRFDHVYDKLNYMTALCDYDLMMGWADDDLYAPWAIETAVKYKQLSGKKFVCLFPFYSGVDGSKFIRSYVGGACIFDPKEWTDFGGISEMNKRKKRCSTTILNKFKDIDEFEAIEMKDSEAYYFWRRWAGSNKIWTQQTGRHEVPVVLKPSDPKFRFYERRL
jgi:hypothetical protein